MKYRTFRRISWWSNRLAGNSRSRGFVDQFIRAILRRMFAGFRMSRAVGRFKIHAGIWPW